MQSGMYVPIYTLLSVINFLTQHKEIEIIIIGLAEPTRGPVFGTLVVILSFILHSLGSPRLRVGESLVLWLSFCHSFILSPLFLFNRRFKDLYNLTVSNIVTSQA